MILDWLGAFAILTTGTLAGTAVGCAVAYVLMKMFGMWD